jgi:hypothetical protein
MKGKSICVLIFIFASAVLSGHLKTGQMWSVQNRPKEVGRELGCFNLPPLGEASLFSYANCVDHT